MFFQVRLFFLPSPQPTKAQLQSYNKQHFLLQMNKHHRLKQLYDDKKMDKNKLNSSAVHRGHYAALVL
jgi:hypothetical protein